MSGWAIWAMLAGGLVGLGAALAIYALTPAHPALGDALARLDERQARRQPWQLQDTGTGGVADWRAAARWVVMRAVLRLPISVPERDLQILEWSRERYLLGRVTRTVAYAGAGPALAALLTIMGTPLPVVVPAGFTLLGALAGWAGYAREVRARADDARQEMRYAVVAYLQQVGLLRAAGAGATTALRRPVELLDDSPAMRRIQAQLELADRAGEMPWEGLRRWAEEVEVDELTDLSTIAETAGQDGGQVIDTLMARAASLRSELLSEELADANRASGQMSTPGAMQVFLIAAWVMYPAIAAVLASS